MVCSGRVFAYCSQVPRFAFSLQKETKVSCRSHHFYIPTHCVGPQHCVCVFLLALWKAYYVSHLPKARHICFILWFPLLKSILPEIPRLLCREDVLSTNPRCELGRSEASELLPGLAQIPGLQRREALSWLPATVSLWAEFSFFPASPPDLSSEKPHCVPFL